MKDEVNPTLQRCWDLVSRGIAHEQVEVVDGQVVSDVTTGLGGNDERVKSGVRSLDVLGVINVGVQRVGSCLDGVIGRRRQDDVTKETSKFGECRATAVRLHSAGFLVYGVARRTDRMQDLAKQGIKTLAMDVTDEESTTAGVKQILAQTGRIDVLVNNAGYGSYGAVEDVPLEEARRQFEVNLFGAARLIQLVLPGMRERRSGTIVNITSMGGKIYTSFGAWYHATKFAFEAFSDCLRVETKDFGIDVVIIEPGAIHTEWGSIAADHLDSTSGRGAYAEQAKSVAAVFRSETTAKRSSPPEVIGKTVVQAVTARRPKTRYAVGAGAKPLIFMHRWLPTRLFDVVVRRVSGMR